MPSYGVAVAMRIDRAMREGFADEETRKDAYRFLELAERGGYMRAIFAFAVSCGLGLLFAVVIANDQSSRTTGPVIMVALSMFFLMGLIDAIADRRSARKEVEALLASDPSRWRPIAEKLQRIVNDA